MSHRVRMKTPHIARFLLRVATIVALPLVSAAGQTSGPVAARPSVKSDYVGWEVCQGCHLAQVTAWKETKMGKVLLGNPRNQLEARACEA